MPLTSAARAAELRREFDRTFAEPTRAGKDETREDLLALRAGADAYLVRLSDMRGLQARPTIVPLPSPVPALLGLAGVRGTLLPVYSLAALQGQPALSRTPSWMILVEADGPLGLAFDELLEYVTLDRSEIAALPRTKDGAAGAPELPRAARVGDALRPLIDVPPLIAGLRRQAGAVHTHRQE